MPDPKPKPKKVGRPVLPKGHAKTGALQVRLNTEDRRRVEQAAKASKQTLSEWIRQTLIANAGV
jgi:hypothetical protein